MASYRVSANTNNSSKTTQGKTMKNGSTKASYTQTKISVDSQTAFAAETHLAEGLWLEEQLKVVKLRMFRVGTRVPTVSRAEGAMFRAAKDIYKIIKKNSVVLVR
jgi:hypothetical protein